MVDYALRLAREYPERRMWVAGYSNDVFGYVPSVRVLREGGYEGGRRDDLLRPAGPVHRRRWKS